MYNAQTLKDHLAWLEQNHSDSDAEYEVILLLRAMLKNSAVVALIETVEVK